MINIESSGADIYLFSRDDNGNPTIHKDTSFKPYFYYEDNDGNFNTINGSKASKIQFANPWDARDLKRKYDKTYEADVRFSNRYIIDKIEEMKQVPIRKCYLDIEVAKTAKGYEAPGLGNNPILSITCYDSFDKEYNLFCINKTHQDEKELLSDFIKYIREKDPDLLMGWNSDEFDMPVIIKRIEKLLPENKTSIARINSDTEYFGKCSFEMGKWANPKVGGRVLFDLMKAYKKIADGGRESWSLDYISKYELKDEGGKEEYKGDLDDLFRDDLELFIKYNKRDVEWLVLMDEKLRMVEFFDEVRRMCFCKIEDVFMNNKIADCLCLRYARDNNIVLPSVVYHDKEAYEGGYVHDSIPKLHHNIAVMDMKSLYPTCMIGFNTSYETLLPNKQGDCINIDDKYHFKKEVGIIPAIVKPLLIKRNEVKKLQAAAGKEHGWDSQECRTYKMSQLALKIIANAFYGVLGFRKFRLYRMEVAASITYIARRIIKEVHRWFEEQGYEVVYGDTDSCMVTMGDKNPEDIMQMNKDINEYFSTYFRQFGVEDKNNIFELEFETVFKTVFFKLKGDGKGAKKKYSGRVIWEEGKAVDKMQIKGFESRRSDYPQIGRDFFAEVLKMIAYERPEQEVQDYVENFRESLKTDFTAEQMGIPIGISKDLEAYANVIHARAARNANEKHNAGIKAGDKIKYVYIKHPLRVMAFKTDKYMPEGYEIDYHLMIRRLVDLKISPVFQSLGWPYAHSIKIQTKKKLKMDELYKQCELW